MLVGMRASMNVLIPVALLACAGLAALPSAGGIAAGGRIAFALTLQADEVYGLAPGATIPRRLTSTIWASTQPAESPDGRKLLFAANPGGKYDVYAMNLDGSGLIDLTAGSSGNDEQPAWSPDGRRIAFISDRVDQNDEIYVMNADGKGVTRVATDPFDAEFPSWSPAGTQLAFDTGARSSGDVYTIGVDGTGLSQVTSAAANEWGPKWSPDGSLIAYTVDRPDPGSPRSSNGDISVIRPDGTGTRRLTTTPRDDEEYAVWSPDGSKIAYSTVVSPAGNCGIDVVNRDGSGRHSIAPFCKLDLQYDAHYLDWARDGTLHFASQTLNSEIATIGVDGTGESVLTKTDDSSESDPAWSPDGRTIAFASDRSGNEDIWLMTADGRRLRDLTRSSHVDDVQPAWSHDGWRIAFATARGREVFDHTGSPYRLDEVYVMGASGLSPHRVIASAGSNEEP